MGELAEAGERLQVGDLVTRKIERAEAVEASQWREILDLIVGEIEKLQGV